MPSLGIVAILVVRVEVEGCLGSIAAGVIFLVLAILLLLAY